MAAREPALELDVAGILTGSALDAAKRRDLASTVGVVSLVAGSLDAGALALVARAATEALEGHVEHRESRIERYERLMVQLDRLSDESISLVEALVSRLALADSTDASTKAHPPAKRAE